MPPPIPFDSQEYWSQRFENESSFEWLMPWPVLEPRLKALHILPKDSSTRILNLGCGNSDLPLDLYNSGHPHVTSVDFVGSVVERMRAHCEESIGWSSDSPETCPLEFLEMDCLDMSRLPSAAFSLCLDKSTSDAISCGDDEHCTKLRTLCREVARVVPEGGLWCVVSYSRFRQYEWSEGLGAGLWTTERIEEITAEQEPRSASPDSQESVDVAPDASAARAKRRRPPPLAPSATARVAAHALAPSLATVLRVAAAPRAAAPVRRMNKNASVATIAPAPRSTAVVAPTVPAPASPRALNASAMENASAPIITKALQNRGHFE
ncbi:hypothetical protein BG006_005425 [Podila minutissima]|uniref:Methyltransferase domain-containing protein n=1 Tax=Podila minutissima TaxID=64525 RepID=A0A9P5SMM2_9FUNG|nr:hypothetical protein BG006_005425 [Podila minutissima]